MRGLAGILSSERQAESPALCQAMRVALGQRAGFLHDQIQTGSLCVTVGGLRPAPGGRTSGVRDDGWVAVSDARLDNRRALADELICDDHDDTVILYAYRRWGADCVHHLRGDFAFAVWDPSRSCLFLARDPFGVRPLFYARGHGRFAFASEARALLELPELDRSSSGERIAEFLRGDIAPLDQTAWTGIFRLPAGFTAIVTGDGVRAEPYWVWRLPEPAPEPASDLRERLAQLFLQAVARRVPDDGPVAVTLSGGLDSSAVAVTMASLPRFVDEPVPTYSIVFDDRPELSERSFIESVLGAGRFQPHFLSLAIEDPFDGFDQRLSDHAGLFLAPNIGTGQALLAGLRPGTVVLSGHGGDEVLSHGYERFHDLARDGQWLRFYRECLGANNGRVLTALRVLSSYYAGYATRRPRVRRFIKRILAQAGASRGGTPVDDLLSERLGQLWPARSRPDFDPTLGGRERHMAALADPEQQYALELLDRDAAASGREVRFPFWDRDLVEFMLSVPADQKLRNGWSRSLMRRAMKGRLPDKVRLRRDKHDFSHHLISGLLTSEAASQTRFERDGDSLVRYLNLKAVQDARQRIVRGRSHETGVDAQRLWRATAVAEWLKYADREGIEIVE